MLMHTPLNKISIIIIGLVLAGSLAGCGVLMGEPPADGNLTREDYRALRERHDDLLAEGTLQEPPIPPLVAAPAPQPAVAAALPAKLVSITVTDQVALRDVLVDLAREAGANLELDPRIEGGIIFSAKDQPFDEVLERICDLAGLRYRAEGKYLRIELDEPYMFTYRLDYPSLSRRTESEVSIATNVFDSDVGSGNNGNSNANGNGNTGNDNNSLARVRSVADADFWGEVEKTVGNILASTGRSKPLLARAESAGAGGAATKADFTLNRQAGIVSVYGTGRQHRAIKDYLQQLQHGANAQVLIEARIVEVELSEKYRSGINWRTLFGGAVDFAGRFGTVGAGAHFIAPTTAAENAFTASLNNEDIAGILNLVREFGTTRILSSPRLTVLNNQTAVLKVARNEVYFTTSAQFPTTISTGGVPVSGTPVFTSTPRTVPVGLVMTVQPSVDQQTQQITMTLRPTISRIVKQVPDPSIGLNAAQQGNSTPVESLIPVLAVREMDSVLRMRSGEVAIMGGLMQDSTENNESGIPPFDEAPALGLLGKSNDNTGATTELVILLRASIVKSATPDMADAALYDKFGRDPRPLLLPVVATPPASEPREQ